MTAKKCGKSSTIDPIEIPLEDDVDGSVEVGSMGNDVFLEYQGEMINTWSFLEGKAKAIDLEEDRFYSDNKPLEKRKEATIGALIKELDGDAKVRTWNSMDPTKARSIAYALLTHADVAESTEEE